MKDLEEIFNAIEWKSELIIKCLFLVGLISPILSILALCTYYFINDLLTQEIAISINKILSFLFLYLIISFIVSSFLSFISINLTTDFSSFEKRSMFYLESLSYSIALIQYCFLGVLFLNLLLTIKNKTLLIPLPNIFVFNFTKYLDYLKNNDESKTYIVKEMK